MAPAPPLALYIHWPFCVSKCPYCDFNSHVRDGVDAALWQQALLADMAHEATLTPGRSLGSIFFGGGTPSLMPPALVASLIEAAGTHWRFAPDIEITLEANPNSAETTRFGDLAAAGVNRVSLGLQALDDAALRFLGRAHDAAEGARALDAAQRHFARVNADLIYALPGQSAEMWRAELSRMLDFGTGHLSLYQLTIEPGTRFETMVRRGDFTPLDPDAAAGLYELTCDMTAARGIYCYEISNYAHNGLESSHNLTYWRYRDYIGIGPGAHGRRHHRASERHRKPENWLAAVEARGHGISADRPLEPGERAREALLMGLRLVEGVDVENIARATGLPPADLIDAHSFDRIAGHGLMWRADGRIGVTPAGMLVLDRILSEIVAI